MAAIELRDVCKSLPSGHRIDRVSLRVEEGETFGLLGPAHAGKTALLAMISGLLAADSGEIDVLGLHLPREAARVRKLSGIVPQKTVLYEHLTAWDNLAISAGISGIPRRKKPFHISSMLTVLHLFHLRDTRVCTFSPGVKQRLALGCALLAHPLLLYLDEPTSALDVEERFALWDYTRSVRSLNTNKTCVIATTSLEEAYALCDRIALLSAGKLLTTGTPHQLQQRYGDICIDLDLLHPFPSFEALKALPEVKRIFQHDRTLSVIVYESKRALPQVIALVSQLCEIKTLRVREMRLDEVLSYPSGTVDNYNEKD